MLRTESLTIGCKDCGNEVILLEYDKNTIDAFCINCECYKEHDQTMMIPYEEKVNLIEYIKYRLGML